MGKLIVKPNDIIDINRLLKTSTKVDGIIFPVTNFSVSTKFHMNVDDINELITKKEKIVLLNKIIHNSDLFLLEEVLRKIKKGDISKIIFYDMAVYTLAKKVGVVDKLIIGQDHMNRSIESNKFYNKLGIKYSYITSDITREEIEEIKLNTNMQLFYRVYGRMPLFCSRRYLLSNYFKYINKEKKSNCYMMKNGDKLLKIEQEKYATTIYSDVVDLSNKINELDFIDYFVIEIDNDVNVIDKFINKEFDGKEYCLGFYDTKTIFKVK